MEGGGGRAFSRPDDNDRKTLPKLYQTLPICIKLLTTIFSIVAPAAVLDRTLSVFLVG